MDLKPFGVIGVIPSTKDHGVVPIKLKSLGSIFYKVNCCPRNKLFFHAAGELENEKSFHSLAPIIPRELTRLG